MSVEMKNTRQKLEGSLNKKIPTKTVPTAPIPVQTAYAVPIGKPSVAFINSPILITRDTTKPKYQRYISVPLVSFVFPKHDVKPTSNIPAIINNIQYIKFVLAKKRNVIELFFYK